MAEPTITGGGISLSVIAIAILGPLAGPYALIVFSALAGALWPLSASPTPTRSDGAWLLLRCTITAVLLTVFIAQGLDRFWAIPATEALAPVALIIGAMGNGWRTVFSAIGAALGAVIGKAGDKNA